MYACTTVALIATCRALLKKAVWYQVKIVPVSETPSPLEKQHFPLE